MTPAAAIIQNAKEVRHRLRNPINAVDDIGIDLKRKRIPEKEKVLDAITVKVTVSQIHAIPVQKRIMFASILRDVCSFYGIRIGEILGTRRTNVLTKPRHIAMYLAIKHTCLSIAAIGRRFNRDHTTVMHAQWRIQELVLVDDETANDIREIEKGLVFTNGYVDPDHPGLALAAVPQHDVASQKDGDKGKENLPEPEVCTVD
jgi:chromosomal replication initiation ATPase DnaA